MFNQKGFSKIAIIIIVLILVGGAYFVYSNSKKDKDVNLSEQTNASQSFVKTEEKQILIAEEMPEELTYEENLKLQGWKTYRNEKYGFEMKYPAELVLRDGVKDYKSAGLNNFYQFCNKVITVPDGSPLGPNDNFVGSCDGEFFRVNIWNYSAEMKMIANELAMLKLYKENKITIGDKTASDFIYSGYSDILGGMHTWHLFVVKTNNYIYSITGDYCMDDHNKCNQILSTFKFIK